MVIYDENNWKSSLIVFNRDLSINSPVNVNVFQKLIFYYLKPFGFHNFRIYLLETSLSDGDARCCSPGITCSVAEGFNFGIDKAWKPEAVHLLLPRAPTHPMNVRVHVGWKIKVKYVGDELEVDSTDYTGFFIFIAFALRNSLKGGIPCIGWGLSSVGSSRILSSSEISLAALI